MKVLVDSSIWSLRIRRAEIHDPRTEVLGQLITENRAVMIGPVRQELLSGIRHDALFVRVRASLRAFEDRAIETVHHEKAAACYNQCRAHGIQGSSVDFLICAVALLDQLAIYTADADFDHFAKHLPIKRYRPT